MALSPQFLDCSSKEHMDRNNIQIKIKQFIFELITTSKFPRLWRKSKKKDQNNLKKEFKERLLNALVPEPIAAKLSIKPSNL